MIAFARLLRLGVAHVQVRAQSVAAFVRPSRLFASCARQTRLGVAYVRSLRLGVVYVRVLSIDIPIVVLASCLDFSDADNSMYLGAV
jgi:hypothetical protein